MQIDVKFIAPLSSTSRKRYYQFTAIDDCTRLRVLRIYDRPNQKTAIQFADYVLDKFPFRIEAIQTDIQGVHREVRQGPQAGDVRPGSAPTTASGTC